MSVTYVYDTDILDTKYQLIVHQTHCNAKYKKGKGLALEINKKFPHADVYKDRKKDSIPGTIEVRGSPKGERFICAAFAQINPGKPQEYGEPDSEINRQDYFQECLDRISRIHNLREVAFPYKIGCGLAKGNWEIYETLIKNFAAGTNAKVYIVSNESKKTTEKKLKSEKTNKDIDEKDAFEKEAEFEISFVEWLARKIKNDHSIIYDDEITPWVDKFREIYRNELMNPVEDDEVVEVPEEPEEPAPQETWETTSLEDYTEKHIPEGWEDFFKQQLDVDNGALHELSKFLNTQIQKGDIYPDLQNVWKAFDLTKPENVKVVILGQDPYHDIGQAMGISFSVPEGIDVPSSLRNIFKELVEDGFEIQDTTKGDLTSWCNQGVLMINTSFTVAAHTAGSHKKWTEYFTPALMRWLNDNCDPLVFILWGNHAQSFSKYFSSKHKIISSAHPSGLSAHKGFFGSKPFSKANKFLAILGREPVDWGL